MVKMWFNLRKIWESRDLLLSYGLGEIFCKIFFIWMNFCYVLFDVVFGVGSF